MSPWLDQRRLRWAERDRRWATRLNRASSQPGLLVVLVAASRLGDGPLWYAAMLLLPLVDRAHGWACTQQMLVVGGLNLALYALLKRGVGRPRPFVDCPEIRLCTPALDRFSFPSGHTLHAVSFGLVLAWHYPSLALPLSAFATLVAASRVVLGLHYPSDVAVGALIGVVTTGFVLALS